MKTEWSRDEMYSVKVKLERMLERMKHNSEFYDHPALNQNISTSFRVAYIELSNIVEIIEGDIWDYKEGEYGDDWFMKPKKK